MPQHSQNTTNTNVARQGKDRSLRINVRWSLDIEHLFAYADSSVIVELHNEEANVIRHVAGVGEIVDDVETAVAFYRDVLGLEVEYDGGGQYADVKVAGIAHYGLWGRRAAAESILGDPDLADQVPLGFSLGFEVDSVEEAARATTERGLNLLQSPKTEPWGQTVCRFILPGGLVGEFAETPWARQLGD